MQSKESYSIAVITCWFGPYPWYFPYFIHSCAFNPTIDFFLITDIQESIPNKPENVKIIYKTFEIIKSTASDKLGFITTNINDPYKLNDYKPAYAFLFPEIVESYDFWCHSDLDNIFGNIREFLNHEMLIKYDFISLRHDYTTGCFALYKNNEKMNTFFMRSKDYRLIFSNPKHYCFDECNFAWDKLKAGESILEIETEIESFTHLMKAAELTNELNVHFDFILLEGTPGQIVFDNGKVIYKRQFEAFMYHLVELKKVYAPMKVQVPIPNRYYISPTQIYHHRKK